MKKYLFTKTSKRPLYVNVLLCLFAIFGILVIPSELALTFNKYINNKIICSMLGDIVFIIILFLIYYKDLVEEFKNYKKDLSNNISTSFKYYIIGILLMITFNKIIISITGSMSLNETKVREVLFNNLPLMLIEIAITAPLIEELVFRKSISTIFSNKWIFALVSGLLFGGAHIMTNLTTGVFVATDLLYILPYGAFGFCFALMNREIKSTFSSIFIHSFHNVSTVILLLLVR